MTGYKTNTFIAEETSEKELIASARLGSAHAFELLADKYFLTLEWYIKKYDIPVSEKDDLIQEGILGLLKAVRTYDGVSSSFVTYASACIKHSIISAVKKYKKHFVNNVSYEAVFSDKPEASAITPETYVIGRENIRRLHGRILAELSPYEIEVFRLYLSGYKHRDIAFKTGRNEKSVGNAIGRIRGKLKKIDFRS